MQIYAKLRPEASRTFRKMKREYLEYKINDLETNICFSTGFYSPLRTLAFLNGFLDPQTFGRTPLLGDQSKARPVPTHRTTQHRNTHTHLLIKTKISEYCTEAKPNLRRGTNL
jgi:hypothetical protein